MLTDFHRGFATYLASFTRSNFHQHRSEPSRKTREFDEKLRLYLELKPVDLIREQWAARINETCKQKWSKYTANQPVKLEQPVELKQPVKLERQWHIFTSEVDDLHIIDELDQLDAYNRSRIAPGENVSYRAMYLTNCRDSTFWGKWVIHLDGETAHDAWLSITDHLGRGHFDHSVFGLVHEYGPESRLSLVLAADQSDNRLLKIGSKFKQLLKNVEEVIYEVGERQLLIA